MCPVCRVLLYLFGHHYALHQELKIIIQWLLPVVFGAVVFKLLVGAEGYVFGLQDAALPFTGITIPIIRSSRLLYSGCCLWYLVLWFSSCWSDVELRVMCPGCRVLLYLFRHHYALHQELKIIIQWLLAVVFGAVVFKLLVWCGAEGYVSGLQDAALPF